jgi:hypothetical protein
VVKFALLPWTRSLVHSKHGFPLTRSQMRIEYSWSFSQSQSTIWSLPAVTVVGGADAEPGWVPGGDNFRVGGLNVVDAGDDDPVEADGAACPAVGAARNGCFEGVTFAAEPVVHML